MLKKLFGIRKRPSVQIDFTALDTDMHSHLIPGIDDGAQNLEESLELIRGLQSLGFRRIITTPHIMSDYYPNTPEIIMEGLEKVRQAVKAERIGIEIFAAAEYLMDEQFEDKINDGSFLTLSGQYVLVEMSFINQPPNLHDLLFRMQTRGYKPIMAHPERYEYLRGDLERYQQLKDRGCKFQLNLLSLTGHYGSSIQRTAELLIENNMIDYLGTDTHRQAHIEKLRILLQQEKMAQILKTHRFENPRLTAS